MNKKIAIILVGLSFLIGGFLGKDFCGTAAHPAEGSPLSIARSMIDGANGDQAKLSQASDLLRQQIANDPSNIVALFLQARALQQRGLIEMAAKSYEQYFTQKVSYDFAANCNLGELYELRAQLPLAEKYYSGCIQAAPSQTDGWERLILLLLKQGKSEEAKERFKELQKALPASDVVKRLSAKMP